MHDAVCEKYPVKTVGAIRGYEGRDAVDQTKLSRLTDGYRSLRRLVSSYRGYAQHLSRGQR
jgi:hypothetical protein